MAPSEHIRVIYDFSIFSEEQKKIDSARKDFEQEQNWVVLDCI